MTFNPLQAMVMTSSQAKVQSQRSVSSEDRVETYGQTDRGNCITFLANAVHETKTNQQQDVQQPVAEAAAVTSTELGQPVDSPVIELP